NHAGRAGGDIGTLLAQVVHGLLPITHKGKSVDHLAFAIVRRMSESHHEFRSAAGAWLDPRLTAVAFGHLAHDGEAGAGSFHISSHRPLKQHENPFGMPSRDPGTS